MAQPSSLAEQIARTKNAFREALTLEQSGRLEGVKSPQIYTAELFGEHAIETFALLGDHPCACKHA